MTVTEIRRGNTHLLLNEAGASVPAFAERLGKDQTYVRNILSGAKNIGNRVAREIEAKCGKPHGWLDVEHRPAARRPALTLVNERDAEYSSIGPLSKEEVALVLAKRAMDQAIEAAGGDELDLECFSIAFTRVGEVIDKSPRGSLSIAGRIKVTYLVYKRLLKLKEITSKKIVDEVLAAMTQGSNENKDRK